MKTVKQSRQMEMVETATNKPIALRYGKEDMKRRNEKCRALRPAGAVILGVLFLTLVTRQAQATVVASDSFSKPDGTPLNGTLTDPVPGYSQLTWSADAGIVIQGGAATKGSGFGAGIPFSPPLTSTFSLAADVQVLSGNEFWNAIGFTSSPDTFGPLNVLLRGAPNANDGFTDYTLGWTGGSFSGTVPGYDPSAVHPVLLSYNPVTSDVSLTIDGQNVFNQPENVNLANISYAGMLFASSGSVDNFVLEVVPEPSVAGLLMLGGLFLWRRRK